MVVNLRDSLFTVLHKEYHKRLIQLFLLVV